MPIKRTLRKIGNSYMVSLPKSWTEVADLEEGDDLFLRVNGKIEIFTKEYYKEIAKGEQG